MFWHFNCSWRALCLYLKLNVGNFCRFNLFIKQISCGGKKYENTLPTISSISCELIKWKKMLVKNVNWVAYAACCMCIKCNNLLHLSKSKFAMMRGNAVERRGRRLHLNPGAGMTLYAANWQLAAETGFG